MTEGKAAADPPHHLRLGGYHHVPYNVAHVSQNRVWRDIDEKVEFPTDWMQQPIVGGKAGTHPCAGKLLVKDIILALVHGCLLPQTGC